MTDENICGAETAGTDEPCQNPAGENGRCWIPAHQPDADDDVENPQGRDPKLTKERQEQIAVMLENGHSVAAACRCNGIGQSTFYEWLDKAEQQEEGIYAEFADRVARARGAGERKLVDELLEMAREDGDARTILSVLKNRYPESWGESDDDGATEERVEVYLTADRD
jgi:transposase-like protein